MVIERWRPWNRVWASTWSKDWSCTIRPGSNRWMPLSRSDTRPLEHYWADCNAWSCDPTACSGTAPLSLWSGRPVDIGNSICFIASPHSCCSCTRDRSSWMRSRICRTVPWSNQRQFWSQLADASAGCNFCRGDRCAWMRLGCEWWDICLLPISTSICCPFSHWLR